LTTGHIFVGSVSNVATDVPASGDASVSSTGAFTVSKFNGGTSFGTLAGLGVGTGLSNSGGNLNIANTITAAGPIGGATVVPVITYNAQGQLTAVSTSSIAFNLSGTSSTNVTIATGAQTFTTQSGLLFQSGQFILISSAANASNYMHGTVTSYSGTSLVVNVLDVGGSGAHADWNISISGPQGPQGAGTINAGTTGQISYYASSGSTVSGSSAIAITANGITLGSGFVDNVRTVTAAGSVTVLATDSVICINKTIGAATTVNLPSSPATGLSYWIKDCKGDAATNNITVTPNAGNIDGAATFVIRVNRGSANIKYTVSEWSIF